MAVRSVISSQHPDERGERNVGLLNIEKLAKALGVEMCDLFRAG